MMVAFLCAIRLTFLKFPLPPPPKLGASGKETLKAPIPPVASICTLGVAPLLIMSISTLKFSDNGADENTQILRALLWCGSVDDHGNFNF